MKCLGWEPDADRKNGPFLVIGKSNQTIPLKFCQTKRRLTLNHDFGRLFFPLHQPPSLPMDPELDLLESCPRKSTSFLPKTHSLVTAPVLTRDAVNVCYQKNWIDAFPQRGLLGSVLSVNQRGLVRHSSDPRIYVNLDAPSSGLICGVQVGVSKRSRGFGTNSIKGSGKSHTLSCILEASLVKDEKIGALPAPLSSLVWVYYTHLCSNI